MCQDKENPAIGQSHAARGYGYGQGDYGDDAVQAVHLRFEQLVADLAGRLVDASTGTLSEVIDQALGELLGFFDVDRCALMEFSDDKLRIYTRHAAYREGMRPQPEIIEVQRDFPFLGGQLLAGNVQYEDARHPLPDEARTDRASLRALEVHAFLLIPIAVGSSVTHLMGFNASQPRDEWPDRFVPRLRLIGEVLVNAMKHRAADDERDITLHILVKAGSATSMNDLLRGITGVLRQWSGVEAVGIRLRDGDDYPYYETRGFSPEFVEAERHLCVRNTDGRAYCDESGNSILECLCGDVLREYFDPEMRCFTGDGSFWINSQAELQSIVDRRRTSTPIRIRCPQEGFESVALVPLRAAGETFGLLQFNDSRQGMFSSARIHLFERLAHTITSAIARLRAVESLHRSEERLRNEHENLVKALQEVKRLRDRLDAENKYLQAEIKDSHDFDEIVGSSEPLRRTLRKIEHVADTDTSVLLLGETGTGKELFARAIHHRSLRKERPLVKVNCAALPAALIESELFGHVKGAFTGALSNKVGRFELADGGTLFLDEIGELDLDLQAKLLRVLQEKEFERIGSAETYKADVRIIAATNRDLLAAMEEGSFRSDLYYRLAVFPIEVPPLRMRRADIPVLVWHFIAQKRAQLGREVEFVPQNTMDALVEYDWPGNVRELENVIERAIILSPDSSLVMDEAVPGLPRNSQPLSQPVSPKEIKRDHIVRVLEECGWKIKGTNNAAERLGLLPSTLRYRMKKLGIQRPPHRRE
jgi:transcriptional regulator with GAF, ATPase, and Fis domain